MEMGNVIQNRVQLAKAIVILLFGATDVYVDTVKDVFDFTVKHYITFKMPIGVKHALIETIDVEADGDATLYPRDCMYGNDGVFLFTPHKLLIFSAKKLRDICEDTSDDKNISVPNQLTRSFTTILNIKDIEVIRET